MSWLWVAIGLISFIVAVMAFVFLIIGLYEVADALRGPHGALGGS